jgi:hypothetical protein
LSTSKHKISTVSTTVSTEKTQFLHECCCGKKYNYRSGLWYNKKNCNYTNNKPEENIYNNDDEYVEFPIIPEKDLLCKLVESNEIIKNNERSVKYRASAPTCSDIFAIIPLDKKGLSTGDLYVEDSSTLQLNKRTYFGPVNIDRMRIKLLDDKGNILNLNGADWCLTVVAEILYQY